MQKGLELYKSASEKKCLKILRQVDLFKDLKDAELEDLYYNCTKLIKQSTDYQFIQAQEQVNNFYIILKGEVEACFNNENFQFKGIDDFII